MPKLYLGIGMTTLVSMVLTRCSLLVFFHRINPARWFRWSIYAYVAIFTTANVIISCIAFRRNGCTASDICLERIAAVHAGLNILSDVILLLFPVPTIFFLKRPFRQRVLLYLILAVGSG